MQLLGIKIFKQSRESLKVIKPGWFPFGDYPEPMGSDLVTEPKLPPEVADIYTAAGGPRINVSAIVGRNGAGKSTLIDVLLKIINNFTIYAIGNLNAHTLNRHLSKAYGIYANLYFKVKRTQYRISVRNLKVEFARQYEGRFVTLPRKDTADARKFLNEFFYTIVTNYSLYAYNLDEYADAIEELPKGKINKDWIEGLFHKNDGYFSPVVITPFRQNGSININRENQLAEQRINVLALLAEAQGKTFIENYRPEYLDYSLNLNFAGYLDNQLRDIAKNVVPGLKIDLLVKEAEKIWKNRLMKECPTTFDFHASDKRISLAISYLALKSLKIGLRYPDYRRKLAVIKDLQKIEAKELSERDYYDNVAPTKVSALIDMLMVDAINIVSERNHLTRKIIRCHKFAVDIMKRGGDYEWHDSGTVQVCHLISRGKLKTYSDVFDILPPPFYNCNIRFRRISSDADSHWGAMTGEFMEIKKMSSGERHLLNCLSYALYHIKNIESIRPDKDRLKYKNICLIFDEAELYFHPDYQRRFVKMLLEGLAWGRVRRRDIAGIQILIVTHSPFILTDVFTHNTLYLEEGRAIKVEGETFGANYYDLFLNSFLFKGSSVGEVATEFVGSLARLNDKEKVGKLSEFVGDEFVARYLRNRLTTQR